MSVINSYCSYIQIGTEQTSSSVGPMSADNVALEGRLSDLSLLLFFIDLMFSKAPALMHHALISNLKSALRKGKSRREWAHKLEANGVLLRVGQPSFSNV